MPCTNGKQYPRIPQGSTLTSTSDFIITDFFTGSVASVCYFQMSTKENECVGAGCQLVEIFVFSGQEVHMAAVTHPDSVQHYSSMCESRKTQTDGVCTLYMCMHVIFVWT